MNYTTETLAKDLHLDVDSLKKQVHRKNGKYISTSAVIPSDVLSSIIRSYTKPRTGRSDETVKAAQEIASKFNITTDKKYKINGHNGTNKKPKKKGTQKVEFDIKQEFKERTLAFVFLVAALMVAMFHTATWSISIADISHYPLAAQIAYGIFCAGGIQFTAFTMTIYRGGKWYLIGFGFLDFSIVLMSLAPWKADYETTAQIIEIFAADVLFSFAVAFSIFSYFGLFTEDK